MTRKRLLTATVALSLLALMGIASAASAGEPNLAVDVSAGAVSALATVFALPVRLAACVATVGLGGAVYGLTMGTSELVREELVAGIHQTCGGKYYITPQEVKEFAAEPGRRR